jgi:hypothetical protein
MCGMDVHASQARQLASAPTWRCCGDDEGDRSGIARRANTGVRRVLATLDLFGGMHARLPAPQLRRCDAMLHSTQEKMASFTGAVKVKRPDRARTRSRGESARCRWRPVVGQSVKGQKQAPSNDRSSSSSPPPALGRERASESHWHPDAGQPADRSIEQPAKRPTTG